MCDKKVSDGSSLVSFEHVLLLSVMTLFNDDYTVMFSQPETCSYQINIGFPGRSEMKEWDIKVTDAL